MKVKSFFANLLGLVLLLLHCACSQPGDPVKPTDKIATNAASPAVERSNSFDGSEGSFITLAVAQNLTNNFENLNPGATKGAFFGEQKLKQVLDQEDCIGLRIYRGIEVNPDRSQKANLVIYGARTDLSDIRGELQLEFGYPCPPYCQGLFPFSGTEGTFISTELAENFTNQFQTDHPNAIFGHFFGQQKLHLLLNQTGTVGIRFYHGIEIKEDGTQVEKMVLYSVSANGDDITNGLILDFSRPCPPTCGS